MKKIIMAIAATAMLSTAVFADASIGGWGRAYFVPVWMTKEGSADAEIKANANEVSWGDQPAVGMSLNGGADDIKASIHVAGGAQKIDAYSVTATPFDFLTVTLAGGDSHDDAYRGKGPNFQLRGKNTSWAMWALADGDSVFTRINEDGGSADRKYAEVKLNFEPVTVFAAVYNKVGEGLIKAEDMYKNGQYGIAANLDGIGLARAQWVGRGKEGTMEAAFALTSVENLYLDIGVKYATEKVLTVTAVPQFNAGDFGITAGLQFINNNSGEKAVNSLNVYLQPTYNLGNGYSILAEAIFTAPNLETVSDTALLGANCFVMKGLSSGKVGAGVCFSYFMDKEIVNFGVPVFAEYWF